MSRVLEQQLLHRAWRDTSEAKVFSTQKQTETQTGLRFPLDLQDRTPVRRLRGERSRGARVRPCTRQEGLRSGRGGESPNLWTSPRKRDCKVRHPVCELPQETSPPRSESPNEDRRGLAQGDRASPAVGSGACSVETRATAALRASRRPRGRSRPRGRWSRRAARCR
jgi:hypothetical protein